MTDIKTELRAKLAGSTSQHPVDFDTLAKGHRQRRVEETLIEMYHQREAGWCLITKHGVQRCVWWLTGAVKHPGSHAFVITQPRKRTAHVEPFQFINRAVRQKIEAQPGINRDELIGWAVASLPDTTEKRVKNIIGKLVAKGLIAPGGKRFHTTYAPVLGRGAELRA